MMGGFPAPVGKPLTKNLVNVFVVDYENLLPKNGEQVWGGGNRKDYALSPNAAKEIAMMSSSDKGKF